MRIRIASQTRLPAANLLAGLRLLEDAERENAAKLKALRAEIKAGLNSGAGPEADEAFDRLEAKHRRMAARS